MRFLYSLACLCGLALGGCQSSPQSAPQIPLAPVYQAGSPVTVNLVIRSDDGKTLVRGGEFDADGDVGAQGEQTAEQAQDIKPNVEVPLPAGEPKVLEPLVK